MEIRESYGAGKRAAWPERQRNPSRDGEVRVRLRTKDGEARELSWAQGDSEARIYRANEGALCLQKGLTLPCFPDRGAASLP